MSQQTREKPNLRVAETACLKKGYPHNSFEFAECYDNRPEVQAYARNQRFSDLAIINDNRSSAVASHRSYPIE